ncbi:MAG: NAD+ synthase, partial [Macromonas bipunctata]|nr:NAD+ synthase [Macromonas bipunctata]
MNFQLCVAQLNFVVGDLTGNADKIVQAARQAHAQGAQVLLTPELALCGYAAEDLLLRPAFLDACDAALHTVARETADLHGLHIVVGHPQRLASAVPRTRSVAASGCHNAASVLGGGQITHTYAKRELPNYQVFDERRYFSPGAQPCVFSVTNAAGQSLKVGLLICEDAWFDAPAAEARAAGADVLAVINASPFHVGKGDEREQAMRLRVLATGLPLVYAHLVGGQDEIVFEGRSFALDRNGALAARAPSFAEDLLTVTLQSPQEAAASPSHFG